MGVKATFLKLLSACDTCKLCTQLSLCLSPGPVPIEAHAGTTPDLAPVPTDAVPGAVLVAGSTAGIGATAVPPCQIVADTLATGYLFNY